MNMKKKQKYNIVYLNGCNYSLEVNGNEFACIPKDIQKDICHTVIRNGNCGVFTMRKFYECYYECDKDLEFDKEEEARLEAIDYDELKELCDVSIDTDECSVSTMQTLLECFVENNGKYKDLGYCETCGSYNDEYSIKI